MAEQPAKAVCVIVNVETERVMVVGAFTDDGTGMDPRYKCEILWKSVKDDWPGWEPAYVENDASAEMSKQRRLWQVGLCEDDGLAERIEEHNREVERKRGS